MNKDEVKDMLMLAKQAVKVNPKEAGASIYRIIMGFVPGGHVPTEMLEYHSRLRQERINKFAEYLEEGFEKVTGTIFDESNTTTDTFLDSFEAIVKKVMTTGSEEKLRRYGNVLLKQMYEPDDSELFMKFVDLIDEVSDTQVLLLSKLSSKMSMTDLLSSLMDQNKFADNMQKILDSKVPISVNGKEYEITRSELQFYLLELKAKGLITISGEGADETFDMTIIGKKFLNFIQEYGGND